MLDYLYCCFNLLLVCCSRLKVTCAFFFFRETYTHIVAFWHGNDDVLVNRVRGGAGGPYVFVNRGDSIREHRQIVVEICIFRLSVIY